MLKKYVSCSDGSTWTLPEPTCDVSAQYACGTSTGQCERSMLWGQVVANNGNPHQPKRDSNQDKGISHEYSCSAANNYKLPPVEVSLPSTLQPGDECVLSLQIWDKQTKGAFCASLTTSNGTVVTSTNPTTYDWFMKSGGMGHHPVYHAPPSFVDSDGSDWTNFSHDTSAWTQVVATSRSVTPVCAEGSDMYDSRDARQVYMYANGRTDMTQGNPNQYREVVFVRSAAFTIP